VRRRDVILSVRDLGRSFGRLEALARLDLDLRGGECVALMGPNGCGKTTALRTVAGRLEPSRGTVAIAGHDPHEEPGATGARAALAMVPDSPLLYDDLTVREHLELVAVAHGAAGDDLSERLDALLARLMLSERGDALPRELSRGMRQKAQLACALARPFQLLILDEPVVGLDAASVEVLVTVLEEVRARGGAVLLSTHQEDFSERTADRVLELEEGRVVRMRP
jgi:ABC-2 type transport system ATP-binding protein